MGLITNGFRIGRIYDHTGPVVATLSAFGQIQLLVTILNAALWPLNADVDVGSTRLRLNAVFLGGYSVCEGVKEMGI